MFLTVALPPTIRCETPKLRGNCRVLPRDAGGVEEVIFSPQPQPAALPFLFDGHPFLYQGALDPPLSPQTEWDVADDVSFVDMLAAPAEPDLGPPFSAAPTNHFAFDDPGPSQDFFADFDAMPS